MSEIVPPEEERRRIEVKSIIRALGMLPVLILLAIGFQLLSGKFVSVNNLSIVVQQASINIVLAAGMTFVILTGGIDLSVGSILAASAMIAVIVSLIPEYGMLGIPAAMAIGLAFGLANGCLISFLKLPPFIVTLGSLTAVRGVARLMGGDTTVFNPELPFDFIGNGTLFGIPWLALIALAVILVSWFILRRTVLGTWIYAVGGNQEAARLTGIKVWLVLLFVYGNVFGSSLGVYIAAGGRQKPWQAFASIFKLPLIYTAAAALAINATGSTIPDSILDTANLIGKAGPILAIILLGIQVSRIQLRGNAVLYGGIATKILLGPVLGIGLTLAIGAEGAVRDVLLICSCLPTAINALILTVRFDARPDLLGGILIGSTLWSPLALSVMLYWIAAN